MPVTWQVAKRQKNGKQVEKLERKDLREWIARMSRDGLAPSSVSRAVSAARGFFRFLMLDGHIKRHPAEDIHTPQQSARLPQFLSEEEMERLLFAPDQRLHRRPAIGRCWILYRGLRVLICGGLPRAILISTPPCLHVMGKAVSNVGFRSARAQFTGCKDTWAYVSDWGMKQSQNCSCTGAGG